MKRISNKALYADSKIQATYYARHSARRFSRRRFASFKSQIKAERFHLRQQRQTCGRQPAASALLELLNGPPLSPGTRSDSTPPTSP